jgi:DNA-binding NtrC family response regulator
MARILVVDDDPAMVAVLSEVLKAQHHEILPANNPTRALELFKERQPDLVMTDIEMPEGRPTGLDLLRNIQEINRAIPVIMVTGQATKERAVAALRGGASDFVEKPFQVDELVKRVDSALFYQRAIAALQENVELKRQLRDTCRPDNIVGTSAPMQEVYRLISRVANTDSTVLVLGESGTGKELVARALHYSSRRAAMPFVAVNCSALPEHLLESELFGHRKGAFTGAAFDKEGLFQHADGGTIFLDEIGSMAPGLQTKLLRFLQDKELRRVGDNDVTKVDVRVLAATNEPLQEKMKDKTFREDLYYRISVIPIQLPALRERSEDIPLLAHHFVEIISKRNGAACTPALPAQVMEVLKTYRWPGNVRELQNALERACALCDGGVIQLRDMPEPIRAHARELGIAIEEWAPAPAPVTERTPTVEEAADRLAGAAQTNQTGPLLPLKDFLHKQEVAYIEKTIQSAGGDKEKAAELLGISMATLYRKLAPGSLAD